MLNNKLKKVNSDREVYDSDKRLHPSLEELKNLYKYRDLIVQLIRRDLVSRYKRSILGVLWTMLNPLGTMLVMTIVFSQVFNRVESYPIYVLSGLTIWNLFSQSTTHSMNSIIWGNDLNQRIFLPCTSFIVSAIGSSMINLFLSLVPLMIIMVATGVSIPLKMLLVPIPIFLLAIFSLGISLFLASFSVIFPDIAEMYNIFLRALMYASPIIIPIESLQVIMDGIILKYNPLYYYVTFFRSLVIDGVGLSLSLIWTSFGLAIISLVIGWFVYTSRADKFPYYA